MMLGAIQLLLMGLEGEGGGVGKSLHTLTLGGGVKPFLK